MFRNYHLRLKESNYEKIQKIAEVNNRTMNKQLEHAIELYLIDYEKINGKIEMESDKKKIS